MVREFRSRARGVNEFRLGARARGALDLIAPGDSGPVVALRLRQYGRGRRRELNVPPVSYLENHTSYRYHFDIILMGSMSSSK